MIKESIIKQHKLIFAKDLNNNATLFGGEALKWMDEVAYIAAVRYTKKRLATASVKKVKFFKPVKQDSIAEITAIVKQVYIHKVEVSVSMYFTSLYQDLPERAIDACFILAFIDEDNNLIKYRENETSMISFKHALE